MKNLSKKTILLAIVIMTAGIMMVMGAIISKAEAKTPKAKFYDFSEQLIDGEIKKHKLFIQMFAKQRNLKDC